MIKGKKIFIILILIVFSSGLISCWNYREIDDIEIMVGLAVDKDTKDNLYVLSAEVLYPRVGATEGRVRSRIIKSKGKTIFDAVRKFIEVNGKLGYWAHNKVVIISSSIAEEGMIPIIDFSTRNPEIRPDMNILISSERSAAEILTGYKWERSVISFKLEEALKLQKRMGSFEDVDLWNFTDKLSREGYAPVAPLVYLEEIDGKLVPKLSGMGIFKKDKMVGALSGEETLYYLFIDDETENQVFVVNQIIEGKPIDISLEILGNKTKVKPEEKNGELIMNIDIETDLGIVEISSSENVIEKENRKQLEKDAAKLIERNVIKLINRVQEGTDSDIFGFGNTIKKEMPDLWKKIRKDWDKQFTTLKTNVSVKTTIKKSALTSEPIKVGE